jgi:hypothetical protein
MNWRKTLDERARVLRRILKGDELADFEEALGKIEDWLVTELHSDAKGAAIFVRGICGGGFMLPMQFGAPVPNWIAVYPTPNIYHLVELKNSYHRYVILLALRDRASILEVNLGAATTQAWINRSELRTRVGTEWTRLHYQIHQAHRGDRFFQEKIALLEQLTHTGGHSHLILAGDPEITARIRDALSEKLVDVLLAGKRDWEASVVMATLSSFIEREKQESHSIVERLIAGLRSQDLAVADSAATLDALRWGGVVILVMASDYDPDPGWTCVACGAMGTDAPETTVCPHCGASTLRPLDLKEALLRLAVQVDCSVEVVEQCDELTSVGGIGCLLRLRPELQNRTGYARTGVEDTQAGTGGNLHAAQTMRLARA